MVSKWGVFEAHGDCSSVPLTVHPRRLNVDTILHIFVCIISLYNRNFHVVFIHTDRLLSICLVIRDRVPTHIYTLCVCVCVRVDTMQAHAYYWPWCSPDWSANNISWKICEINRQWEQTWMVIECRTSGITNGILCHIQVHTANHVYALCSARTKTSKTRRDCYAKHSIKNRTL